MVDKHNNRRQMAPKVSVTVSKSELPNHEESDDAVFHDASEADQTPEAKQEILNMTGSPNQQIQTNSAHADDIPDLSQLEKKLPPYDDTIDPLFWLKKLDLIYRLQHWSDATGVLIGTMFLKEDALRWAEANEIDAVTTYAEFRHRLIQRFHRTLPKVVVQKELADMHMREGQSVREFSDKLQDMARASDLPITLSELEMYLITALKHPVYLSLATSNHKTFDELVNACIRQEAILKATRTRHAPSYTATAREEVPASHASNSSGQRHSNG